MTINKKTISLMEYGLSELPFPYAGIIRIRFKGSHTSIVTDECAVLRLTASPREYLK